MGPLDSRPTFGILMKFISHSIFSNNWVEESYRFTVFPRVLVYKNFFEQIEFWSFSTFRLRHVFEIIWHSYYIFYCLSLTQLIIFTKSTSGFMTHFRLIPQTFKHRKILYKIQHLGPLFTCKWCLRSSEAKIGVLFGQNLIIFRHRRFI